MWEQDRFFVPKNHRLNVGRLRLDDLKQTDMTEFAPTPSIVYDLAINGKINEPLSQEMMDCFRKLAGMANNLNQLAHEAHIAGYEDVAAADRLLSEKIDEVLNKLSELR